MIEVSFFVPGLPEAWKRPRYNRGRDVFFTQKTSWRDSVCWWSRMALRRVGKFPIAPIEAVLIFYFPAPKTMKLNSIWKFTKPDSDNLMKETLEGIEDAGLIDNDSRIARALVEKQYASRGDHTGMEIKLSTMGAVNGR